MMNTNTHSRLNTRTHLLALAVGLCAAITSPALGAPQGAGADAFFSDTRIVISVVDGREVKVTQRDGDTKVEVDGQDVPATRFTVDGEWVIVKNEQGEELTKVMIGVPEEIKGDGGARMYRFKSGQGGAVAIAPRAGGMAQRGEAIEIAPGGGMIWKEAESEPPKVMLGVTSTMLSDDLAQHLGVDKASALLIGSVVPESPASAAGLKKGDVIVALNGQPLDESKSLRDRLRDKNPGDEVTLSVIQGGQKNDVKVKLAAYDSKKFATFAPITKVEPDIEFKGLAELEALRGLEGFKHGGAEQQRLADKLRRMAEQMKAMKGVDAEAMADLQAEIAKLAEQAAKQGRAMAWTYSVPREGGMNPTAPMAPQPPVFLMDRERSTADTDARLKRLEEQNARLEKMIQQLLEQGKKNP